MSGLSLEVSDVWPLSQPPVLRIFRPREPTSQSGALQEDFPGTNDEVRPKSSIQSFKSMPPKLIVIPALILGLIAGMACKPGPNDPALEHVLREIRSPFVLWILGAYLALTVIIFLFKTGLGGLSGSQLRLLWIMAFLMGSIGGPLIYDTANR